MVNDYKYKIEKFIYKEIAKEFNTVYGLNKTAPLASGIFLKLPIRVQLVKLPEVDYSNIFTAFTAYTKLSNESEVFFTFFYATDKDLPKLLKLLEKHSTFWAYVYQHEVLHILLKHVTASYSKRMQRLAETFKSGLSDEVKHSYINRAEDYFINYSIKDLTNSTSTGIATLTKEGLYNSTYHSSKLSDVQILEDLLKNTTIKSCPIGDSGYELQEITDGQGNKSVQINNIDAEAQSGANGTTGGESIDTQLADLAESINSTIQTQAKGSSAAAITDELFGSIKINTDWFKKLKTTFERDVYYMTHNYYTKWSNLNNRYRSIFKSPKKYYLDTKLEIVLSIDQSGSMPRDSLQKLLYLMEEKGSSISKLTVLIHDVDISKEFVLESDYGIDTNHDFKKALATRYQSGGTSHAHVFKWLQENIHNPEEAIYISFSDNGSDIKQVWGNYPILRRMKTYLVCPINNPMAVPAVNILME